MTLSLPKRILFAILPSLLLLLAAEGILRWTGAAQTCPTYKGSWFWECDPILYFRTSPDIAGGLNEQGFRGRDFGPKSPDTYRVLTLGDSCTFGVIDHEEGFLAEHSYPQRLEELVSERLGPGQVEVLNGGAPGYNSYQGLVLLRTKLRGLEPDLITVRFGWNDHFISPEAQIAGAFREPRNPWVLALQDLLFRTQLYPFSQRLGMELRLRLQGDAVGPGLPREWKPNVPLDDYRHHLHRIVEIGRGQGAEVWLLTAPSALLAPALLERYEALPDDAPARRQLHLNLIDSFSRMRDIHAAYNEATRTVAAESGAPLIDIAETYVRFSRRRLFSRRDFVHPTQQGYDLEAELLYEELTSIRK